MLFLHMSTTQFCQAARKDHQAARPLCCVPELAEERVKEVVELIPCLCFTEGARLCTRVGQLS